MDFKRYHNRTWRHLASGPFIYIMIIPLALLHLFLEIYHQICFRLYKIPLVARKNYIKIDRHKLKYLTWSEKVNCMYCSYANGLAAYLVEIAGRTEKYWCGIKHEKSKDFIEPKHHKDFIAYNDEKAYKEIIKGK